MSKFFFRCSFEVVDLGRPLPDTDELEFRFDKPRPLVVRLGKAYPDQRKPVDTTNAVCTADTSEEVIDEKLITELTRSLSFPGEWVDLKGVDPRTVEVIHGMVDELYSVMIQTVAVFRWRCGLAEGPLDPRRNLKGYCSQDGKLWRKCPC